MVARRAHNPEVVGSSPASATIKTTAFAVVFLCLYDFLRRNGTYQISFDTNFDTNAYAGVGVVFIIRPCYGNYLWYYSSHKEHLRKMSETEDQINELL